MGEARSRGNRWQRRRQMNEEKTTGRNGGISCSMDSIGSEFPGVKMMDL